MTKEAKYQKDAIIEVTQDFLIDLHLKISIAEDEASSMRAKFYKMSEEFYDFLNEISNNYDHEEDAHKYSTHCRCCEAEKLLNEFFAEKSKDPFSTGTK